MKEAVTWLLSQEHGPCMSRAQVHSPDTGKEEHQAPESTEDSREGGTGTGMRRFT